MSSAFGPYVFFAIMVVVFLLAHAYVYWRLTHYLQAAWLRWTLRLLLPALYVLVMSWRVLVMPLPLRFEVPLSWLTMGWLGVLLMACLAFGAVQALELVARLRWRRQPMEPERRALFRRLAGYGGLGATGALTAAGLYGGLRPVTVKAFSVSLNKLPAALDGLRLVQISDLHIGPTLGRDWLAALVERVNALAPDLILITGDLSDGGWQQLREQVAPLAGLHAPEGVFFCTGNHEYFVDWRQWIRHLPELGVQPLCNERVTLHPRGGTAALDLAGVNDYTGERVGHAPDFAAALAGRDASRPLVLLAHQPRAVLEAARYGVDLQLSGHTHDGQIWPFGYIARLLQPYVVGLHRHPGSDTQIYVSPGTGYWGPPMRLGTAAEITHITLRSVAA